jgi:hypothetical protein
MEPTVPAASMLSTPEKPNLPNLKAIGFVDKYSEERIAGWAYLVGNDGPIEAELKVFVDDQDVGTVPANIYREDLEKAGHGTGRYGFAFVPPEGLVARAKSIEVRTLDDQTIGRRFERE